jgi:hypothetical protein
MIRIKKSENENHDDNDEKGTPFNPTTTENKTSTKNSNNTTKKKATTDQFFRG